MGLLAGGRVARGTRIQHAFYRRQNLPRPPGMDPLFHHLEKSHAQKSPRNEVEARADLPPWREGAVSVLEFHQGRGGGSSHFLDLQERDIESTGRNVIRARTILKAPTLAVIDDRTFDLSSGRDLLIDSVRQRRVTRLVANHLIDRLLEMMTRVHDLSARLGVPYDVVLHDYFMLSPLIDLITRAGAFCDMAPAESRIRCIADYGAEMQEFDPLSWRHDHLAFLESAERGARRPDGALAGKGDHGMAAGKRRGFATRANATGSCDRALAHRHIGLLECKHGAPWRAGARRFGRAGRLAFAAVGPGPGVGSATSECNGQRLLFAG
ncbi:hypothetical protein [uncultured Reyranella sp.]|uniref:hypothetical protein n=1 Tax=uncultured Reyranella sp. TaxID=735512 RepID=UPI0025EE8DE9|nr:hypothetical protein [uncultured Reyranella sp.]